MRGVVGYWRIESWFRLVSAESRGEGTHEHRFAIVGLSESRRHCFADEAVLPEIPYRR